MIRADCIYSVCNVLDYKRENLIPIRGLGYTW